MTATSRPLSGTLVRRGAVCTAPFPNVGVVTFSMVVPGSPCAPTYRYFTGSLKIEFGMITPVYFELSPDQTLAAASGALGQTHQITNVDGYDITIDYGPDPWLVSVPFIGQLVRAFIGEDTGGTHLITVRERPE